MKRKSGLSKFNSFLAIVLVVCLVATAFVINKYPKIEAASADDSAAASDEVVIDEFKAGTYGAKSLRLKRMLLTIIKNVMTTPKLLLPTM